jgi:hypothetical protein
LSQGDSPSSRMRQLLSPWNCQTMLHQPPQSWWLGECMWLAPMSKYEDCQLAFPVPNPVGHTNHILCVWWLYVPNNLV